MFNKEEKIESFRYEYKQGLIGKKNVGLLIIYEKHIEGIAAEYHDGKFNEYEFNILFKHINSIEKENINGQLCLVINYRKVNTVVRTDNFTIVFPKMENTEEIIRMLLGQKSKAYDAEKLENEEKEKLEEERFVQEKQELEERKQYYNKCYNFHISDKNNPYYELYREELQFACIYIDENKNLNFLKIDGRQQEENNAYIPYDKIHYYEKAGSVHYTSDINGSCTSFGGSISGATVSKTATVLGGLLFGPMGMATGAVLTHKPMKAEMPTTNFNISSEHHKIDDRSVILNYYSDIRKQYIDIELPADIYNFLQTYLPERKHSIVLELEKETAVRQCENQRELTTSAEETKAITVKDDMDVFENKVKKLKIMHDNGIISDEEFEEEKRKILSLL